jgi:DNA modification methylase
VNVYNQHISERAALYHGDCVHVMKGLPDESVGFSVYSPPFGDLFVYSDSVADLGNVTSDEQFFEQYSHVVAELYRVLKPGRLVAVHCTDLPTRKFKDGVIGVKRFSDAIGEAHEAAGFIFHCRVTVWRDPVVEMQRTKALGLLYNQIQKDSAMSRVGLADYVMVFRKPGDNAEPIGHCPDDFPVDRWQQWASPVWMDIRQGNVLNVRVAREAQDEKHLCPLQLDLIERAITLWSNEGDTVLSPFMGIGSEGYVAVKCGRRYVGAELKEAYFRQAVRNVDEIEAERATGDFFTPRAVETETVATAGRDGRNRDGDSGEEGTGMRIALEIARLVLLEIVVVGSVLYLAALAFLLIYGPVSVGFFALGIGVIVARTLLDLIDDFIKRQGRGHDQSSDADREPGA